MSVPSPFPRRTAAACFARRMGREALGSSPGIAQASGFSHHQPGACRFGVDRTAAGRLPPLSNSGEQLRNGHEHPCKATGCTLLTVFRTTRPERRLHVALTCRSLTHNMVAPGTYPSSLSQKWPTVAAESGRLNMAQQIMRCPYCVLGDDFRPMLFRPEGWFICQKCGHTSMPGKPEFQCFCHKCEKLKRAA